MKIVDVDHELVQVGANPENGFDNSEFELIGFTSSLASSLGRSEIGLQNVVVEYADVFGTRARRYVSGARVLSSGTMEMDPSVKHVHVAPGLSPGITGSFTQFPEKT